MEEENVIFIVEEVKTENEINEENDINEMFNLSKKKKHKKDKEKKNKKENIEEINKDYDPPTYTYQTMLERVYSSMNPEDRKENSKKITAPIINRINSKKIVWPNFNECCLSINRDKEHLQQYILCELNTEGSIDGNSYLILKGNYNQKNIENLLRKYVSLYVQCTLCRSINTNLKKDQSTRLNFLLCNECKGSRTVQNINIGFRAATKADRKKEKEQ